MSQGQSIECAMRLCPSYGTLWNRSPVSKRRLRTQNVAGYTELNL